MYHLIPPVSMLIPSLTECARMSLVPTPDLIRTKSRLPLCYLNRASERCWASRWLGQRSKRTEKGFKVPITHAPSGVIVV